MSPTTRCPRSNPKGSSALPSEIARINLIFFTDQSAHQTMADRLATALKTNRQWWLEQTRLVGLAVRWHEGGRKDHELLRGEAIGAAVGWSHTRPTDALNPPEVFDAFLNQSREFEEQESRRQHRMIGRAFVKPTAEAYARGEHDHAIRLAAAGALLAGDSDLELVPELWSPLDILLA